MNAALAFVAGFLWLIAANLIGMFPSKDYHWSNAYRLIAVGLPILIWITWANGLVWGAVFLGAAGSVLRWPLVHAWHWLKQFIA